MKGLIMKGGAALPKDFNSIIGEAAELIRSHSFARVISHYDADGISAAGIMIASLKRAGIEYQATISRSLDRATVESIADEGVNFVIFLDMGSGQIEWLDEIRGDVLVLDHHRTVRKSDKVLQVNPHFHGLDGMKDVSASGLSFLVCTALDDKNWASAPLAITGLFGDMQNLHGYSKINAGIIEGAIERKLIAKETGLRLSGNSLTEMISSSVSPYFRQLSGRDDAAAEFLRSADLDESAAYGDLKEGGRRKLISMLTLRLLGQGCSKETVLELSGDIVTASANSMRIDDLTELLNACGRTDHPGIGLALCLGDLDALREATRFRKDYDRMLLSALGKVEDDGAILMKHIQVLKPSNPSLAGAICGISMQYLLEQDKPTLAITRSEGSTKVSSRATKSLVDAGVNLAESMKSSAEQVGGVGGGHTIAAGATVPIAKEDQFLELVDSMTGRQLGAGS